ncbi:probable endopeptidase p60 [Neopsephotus bourkii]|uniref:probable endopeptidase p60 n=1 Tax=Neopsephotus bourkii TaxID=309878 RepID=UPI002AA566CE|nr:probable endopeptidase p60 [Neopsephotus bourkii]
MDKYLGQWATPVLWNFTTEKVQNPEKFVKYLNEVCCHPGLTREGQTMATCWGLAYAYRALFNTIQHLQREKIVSGSDGKATDNAATLTPNTAATPTLVTITAATQTPTATDSTATPDTPATPALVTSTATAQTLTSTDSTATPAPSTAATPAPATNTAATLTTVIITAAKPEDQLMPISVAPVRKGKKKKVARKMK